jgi:copper chaperone CopZ
MRPPQKRLETLRAEPHPLALGFYFAYRKPKASPACEGEVCAPDSRSRRLAKPVLWLAALAVAALALFPLYGAKLVPTATVAAPTPAATLATAELKIGGMTCEACAGVVHNSLVAVPGVAEAEVDYPAGRARVTYDPNQTVPSDLISAVSRAGYTAEIFDPSRGL